MPEAPSAQVLTADQLCQLTGLTDRRHRQIAKAGYFPAPDNGKYATAPTVAGMFKYYREQLAKKEGSLEQEKKKYMKARREKAETETGILKKSVVEVEDAGRIIRNFSIQQKAFLRMRLETELPPKLVGRGVIDITEQMAGVVDEVCKLIRENSPQWMQKNLEPTQQA